MMTEFDDGFENDELDQDTHIDKMHIVQASQLGTRLDKLAVEVFDQFSRASLQKYIQSGELLVNGQITKPKYAVRLGDVLTLRARLVNHSDAKPEAIDLDVVYEDETVLVVNKPAGMVVHPAVGNWTGTLVNALLYHYPDNAHLPRAGIVHRIDKDTTGLLMVAKTANAQLELINQLKNKSVYRQYKCVVVGSLPQLSAHKVIDAPIGRHPTARTKMAIVAHGKPAVTHLMNICPLLDGFCLLDVALETGRTHQIRVHLSSKGHFLIGDQVYGGLIKKTLPQEVYDFVRHFPRQALHAHTLGFVHPISKQKIQVSTPLPDDMKQLVAMLGGAI